MKHLRLTTMQVTNAFISQKGVKCNRLHHVPNFKQVTGPISCLTYSLFRSSRRWNAHRKGSRRQRGDHRWDSVGYSLAVVSSTVRRRDDDSVYARPSCHTSRCTRPTRPTRTLSGADDAVWTLARRRRQHRVGRREAGRGREGAYDQPSRAALHQPVRLRLTTVFTVVCISKALAVLSAKHVTGHPAPCVVYTLVYVSSFVDDRGAHCTIIMISMRD